MNPNYNFIITDNEINLSEAFNFVLTHENGANASFVGSIREKNLGREVVAVSYDICVPLTEKTLVTICDEAQQASKDRLKIHIALFNGRLVVGDISIVIAVSSPHRKESMNACRFLIEEIKHRCPIWKKEYYIDGNSEWVKGHALCQH